MTIYILLGVIFYLMGISLHLLLIQMSICLLVIGQIDLFVLKVSFSVCTSPNIQDETLFLRFKIFLINFGT